MAATMTIDGDFEITGNLYVGKKFNGTSMQPANPLVPLQYVVVNSNDFTSGEYTISTSGAYLFNNSPDNKCYFVRLWTPIGDGASDIVTLAVKHIGGPTVHVHTNSGAFELGCTSCCACRTFEFAGSTAASVRRWIPIDNGPTMFPCAGISTTSSDNPVQVSAPTDYTDTAFARCVALSPHATTMAVSSIGKRCAHVYTRTAGTTDWALTATLKPDDTVISSTSGTFASTVLCTGSTITMVVCDHPGAVSATTSASVYGVWVFTSADWSKATWIPSCTGSDAYTMPSLYPYFARSIDITPDGGTLVGVAINTSAVTAALCIMERDPSSGSTLAAGEFLAPSTAIAWGDTTTTKVVFGTAISADGNTALLGTPTSASVFKRPCRTTGSYSSNWTETATISLGDLSGLCSNPALSADGSLLMLCDSQPDKLTPADAIVLYMLGTASTKGKMLPKIARWVMPDTEESTVNIITRACMSADGTAIVICTSTKNIYVVRLVDGHYVDKCPRVVHASATPNPAGCITAPSSASSTFGVSGAMSQWGGVLAVGDTGNSVVYVYGV